MVTAYQVVTGKTGENSYEDRFTYLFELQAASHLKHIKEIDNLCPSRQSEWYSQIENVEIDSLPNQKVRILGNKVLYQFSRTTNGKRTVVRKVYNIRKTSDNLFLGEVKFIGRRVLVVKEHWYQDWESVGLLEIKGANNV